MTFLQPMLLFGLPLVALPVIIHLINQRRYQTVRWAAMMFLLAANRMSRGYARLRQWLIMALRMAAIAGLTFAVSRPLAGGWLGVTAGGRPDTTIVLFDRSPSMQQAGAAGGSKLETGRRQLVQTLEMLGSSRWIVIESGTNRPQEVESAQALMHSPAIEPAAVTSDIAAMLQAAHDYIKSNKSGRTEVWICSDLRENDWNAESGRWQTVREAFLEFPQGVRFHLLAYPQKAPGNLSVRVTDVRWKKSGDAAELLVSLRLTREGGEDVKATVPVQFEIDGARSEINVEMAGPQFELKGHRIPLEKSHQRGYGKVSIPADGNPADNDSWFVFDQPATRQTVIVAEDPQAAQPLELAAGIAPDPSLQSAVAPVGPSELGTVEWEKVALLLWQAPLPGGETASAIRAFIERGGQAVFFPPRTAGDAEFLGMRWTTWVESKQDVAVENWRGDHDLLAHTQSGTALPVGQLQVRRSCGLSGESTALATLRGGAPLLARGTTNAGGAYFCATTPAPADSSLASNGVVLYAMIQRALDGGALVLGSTRRMVAGELPPAEDPKRWKRLAGDDDAVTAEYAFHAGVYASGDRLLSVNRSPAEDSARVLADGRVAGLFRGLDFARVDDQAGNLSSLIQEIWRLFLIGMMVALVVEAALCLPKTARTVRATA
ncbi:MAG: BatA domain-containing protein [Isosphaeraceae bacterium]|nr:BatA domain-containing protein [Isosphaeraceae bacterium]